MDASNEQDARGRGLVGRRRERRRERDRERDPDHVAGALKERIYATFTGLAIVLVQLANVDHLTAARVTGTLAVGILAITAAGFVADVIAHLAVHAQFPTRDEFRGMLGVSSSALGSASVPLILLVLAWLDVLELEAALRISSIVYLVTLGVIAWAAVRRTRVEWWKQLVAMGLIVALGFLVVLLQQLAHGH